MTWKEFKDAVERVGVREEDFVEWIDIHVALTLNSADAIAIDREDGVVRIADAF